MLLEMFPWQSMDKLLRLKLEILYKDFPAEQARQAFDEIKAQEAPPQRKDEVKVRRKLRIPAGEKVNA